MCTCTEESYRTGRSCAEYGMNMVEFYTVGALLAQVEIFRLSALWRQTHTIFTMMRWLGLLTLFAGSALCSEFAETPSATVDLRITDAE